MGSKKTTTDKDGNVSSGSLAFELDDDDACDVDDSACQDELNQLVANINAVIQSIESDQKVQYCLKGRQIKGPNNKVLVGSETKPFPNLTTQIKVVIATSAINAMRDNYFTKFDELNEQMLQDYVKIAGRIAAAAGENELTARRDTSLAACLGYAKASALPMTKLKKDEDKETENSEDDDDTYGYTATSQINNWNYKETVTTTFSDASLVCRKCIRSQTCADPKGGRKFCKEWNEVVEKCTDIQF